MTLDQAIVTLGRENLNNANDWYEWRRINPQYFPTGIKPLVGNNYSQNESLKLQLRDLYAQTNDEEEKRILTHYYIVHWGGIRGNSPDKILEYALAEPTDLILKGKQGIASWSKALCIRNPCKYAIYDARVAVSLNAIQVVYAVNKPRLFPLLASQNKQIINGSKIIHKHSVENRWDLIPDKIFYQEYNRALSVAAIHLGVQVYTLEMLLFSKPIELLRDAFPGEQL